MNKNEDVSLLFAKKAAEKGTKLMAIVGRVLSKPTSTRIKSKLKKTKKNNEQQIVQKAVIFFSSQNSRRLFILHQVRHDSSAQEKEQAKKKKTQTKKPKKHWCGGIKPVSQREAGGDLSL